MEVIGYTAEEIARIDGVSRWTVYRSKKYVKVRFTNYRIKKNKKGYTIRYIRKSDLQNQK